MNKNRLVIMVIMSIMVYPMITKAQENPISLNIRGGLNLSTYTGGLNDTEIAVKQQFGIGLDVAIVDGLYLFTGIDYQAKGTKIKPKSGSQIKFNATYLQLPFHIAYKIKLSENIRISAEAGPYLACGLGGKIKSDAGKVNTFGDGRLKKFDMGAGLGLGFEFYRNFIRAGYDYGFINISDIKGTKIRNSNFFIISGFSF